MKHKAPYLILCLAAFLILQAASCPIDPPDPLPPFNCDDPPAASGQIVQAEDPVPNCYISLYTGTVAEGTGPPGIMPAAATDIKWLPLINGYRSTMPPAAAQALAQDPDFVVYECERVTAPDPIEMGSIVPSAVASWGLDRLDQLTRDLDGKYEPQETGAGVHVFINDTGEPFALNGWNVGECYSAVGGSCKDDHGHGSHVGSTVGNREYGVAPGVVTHWGKSLIRGSGSDADVIEVIDWAVSLCKENDWMCIGNMSLGGPASEPFDRAVCNAIAQGMLWVVAAGNDNGDACRPSPARVDEALTVGATSSTDRRASFSNFGNCVDVFAPGDRIPGLGERGNVLILSGTSMSCPHVAGVAALCAERLGTDDPATLTACVVDNALQGMVRDPGPFSPNLLVHALERAQ